MARRRKKVIARAEELASQEAEIRRLGIIGPREKITIDPLTEAREIYKARKKTAIMRRKKGQLVSLERVKAIAFGNARQSRDRWMEFAVQFTPNAAAQLNVDPHTLEQAVETAIRETLAVMSDTPDEKRKRLAAPKKKGSRK